MYRVAWHDFTVWQTISLFQLNVSAYISGIVSVFGFSVCASVSHIEHSEGKR